MFLLAGSCSYLSDNTVAFSAHSSWFLCPSAHQKQFFSGQMAAPPGASSGPGESGTRPQDPWHQLPAPAVLEVWLGQARTTTSRDHGKAKAESRLQARPGRVRERRRDEQVRPSWCRRRKDRQATWTENTGSLQYGQVVESNTDARVPSEEGHSV